MLVDELVARSASTRRYEPCGAIVIVVDASVLAPALADDNVSGDRARARLVHERLAAPELIDLETASVLRGLTASGKLSDRRARMALADLDALPMERIAHRALLERCWQLKANLTTYDAAYVALAEALDVSLVTADARMAKAPGVRCKIEVMTA